jgi:prephenate dehydrogenase
MSPSDLKGKLVVDVCTIKGAPKALLTELVPDDADIMCTHPMFGPDSAPASWQAQPFVYEQVRIANYARAHQFLNIFEAERCAMVEMSAELHDQYALEPQFVTHLVGRVLAEQHLRSTPIDTAGFKHAQALANSAENDSFDLFFALYKHTEGAEARLASVREAVAHVEKQLAAKEAYLAAQAEYKRAERHTMLHEFRALIREASQEDKATEAQAPVAVAAAAKPAAAKPAPAAAAAAPKPPASTQLKGDATK